MSEEPPVSTVGILPVGALGVAFFHHLTRDPAAGSGRVFFVERAGSSNAATLREKGTLLVDDGHTTQALPAAEFCRPNLRACGDAGMLPEVLLICTQVDQLLPVIAEYVVLLERLHALHGLDAALGRLPVLVLCSNGIYHERVRRFLVELLEESMLYGRLPDLWHGAMGRIVGHLLRGVSIQTGHRTGSGPEAVFHPGPRGRTTLAGGDPLKRRRCMELLTNLGGWFEDAGTTPPVRAEFDKALINLWGNLYGQLKSIDAHGRFRLLRVREIMPGGECPELRELASHVVAVGRAVHAYRADEDFELIYRTALTIAAAPREHIPSSLKWLEAQLAAGTLTPQLAPTEAWLLDPLTRFARTAGLEQAVSYFTSLRERLEERLRLAAAAAEVIHAVP